MKTLRTTEEYAGRTLLVSVEGPYLEIWRNGDRIRRLIPLAEVYEKAAGELPPATTRTGKSIVAFFVRHRGKASIWQRQDTKEEMTELQLRKRGKAEGRPVLLAYGPVIKEMRRHA